MSFLWRFALAYGLLIAPWPGFNAAYARGFRSAGNLVFARENDARLLKFEPVLEIPKHLLDTRILLANRRMVNASGNTPAKYLELDTRAVGWIPTAMVVALILSTPFSWRRRILALLWGMLAVHAFIVFSLAIYIWNNSTDLGLLTLSPFTKRITGGLEETLITQLGASFVVPVLIWILTVIDRSNLVVLRHPESWFLGEGSRAKSLGK